MNQKHVKWLLHELPDLVRLNLLSPEAAQSIRLHYEARQQKAGPGPALLVFGILGTLLVGSGIILLLAHNWENMSRLARAIVSITPLVLSQILGAWTLSRDKSAVWREASGILNAFAIGTAISLIAQTYNISGDFSRFMLTWSLLALPMVYLLWSNSAAILYMIGILIWTFSADDEPQVMLFWPLAALVIPYSICLARTSRFGARTTIFFWVASAVGAIAFFPLIDFIGDENTLVFVTSYAALFAVFYLSDDKWFTAAASAWQRPMRVIGLLGSVVLLLVFSFEAPWEGIQNHQFWFGQWPDIWRENGILFGQAVLLIGLLLGCWIYLWVRALRMKSFEAALFTCGPLAIVGAYLLTDYAYWPTAAGLIISVVVFAMGVVALSIGLRRQSLAKVNASMLLLMFLILLRFLDESLGFAARGVVFILLGVCFLSVNFFLVRRFHRMEVRNE